MTLAFSTELNGKPTYFVDKIFRGIYENNLYDLVTPYNYYHRITKYLGLKEYPYKLIVNPKIHTIRADEKTNGKRETLYTL